MAEATNKFDYTKLNTLAVVSLATGVTLFGAPAAVITGHIALAQIKDSDQKGRWMAITGLVLGYFGIALALVATIVNAIMYARHGVPCMQDMNMYGNFCPQYRDYMPMHDDDMWNQMPTDMPTIMPGTN